MKHVIGLGLLLLWVWYWWSGFTQPLFLFFAAISVTLVLVLAVRMRTADEEGSPWAWFHPRTAVYIPWLLLEIVKSSLDITKRVLNPGLPIQRQMLRAKSTQKTQVGRVVFANSITLTPGTVSVIVDEEEILVHAVCDVAAEGLRTGDMDARVTRWEGGK